jgi:hypothetical protein
MALRVVGAGLPRTGTNSVKIALERLLGGPCYHMIEVFPRPDHVAAWHRAIQGDLPDWDGLFDGFRAAVDYPTSAFWREIAAAYPGAIILLTVRSPEDWWRSIDATILDLFREGPPEPNPWWNMANDLFRRRFTERYVDRDAAIAAYERHNAAVRALAPRDRLFECRTGEGWEPLCRALGVPVPDEPFPHVNTTADWRARAGH